jgi:arylsulfatase A-like enzyme
MCYPRGFGPGQVRDEIILNVDFASTFLDYAGLPIPEHFQGRSFRPILEGDTPSDWRRGMYYRYWMHLADHNVYAHYGLRTERYKLIYYYADALGQLGAFDGSKEPEWELFDLETDPYELDNIADEPDKAELVGELRAELERVQLEVGDTPYVRA